MILVIKIKLLASAQIESIIDDYNQPYRSHCTIDKLEEPSPQCRISINGENNTEFKSAYGEYCQDHCVRIDHTMVKTKVITKRTV